MWWAPGTGGGLVGPYDRLNRAPSRVGFGLGPRGGRCSGFQLRRTTRRSRRAPAKPTMPSGSSAAALGTSCTTTMSTASGRPASSGGATWTAAVNGRIAGARRPRCAREAEGGGVGVALSSLGASPGRPNAQATPRHVPGPGTLERSPAGGLPLFVHFSPGKYQKLDYQLDFQTLKDKEESGKWFGKKGRAP